MKALKQTKKSKAKTIIYTSISMVVLLGVLVGGAVAYIWYTGKQTPEASAAKPVAKPVQRFIKPTQPKPDAVVNVSVQMLTSPVQAGGSASVTIKTNAAANCTIRVTYSATVSKDAGLKTKQADEFGTVNWTWTVESSVAPGKYPVAVTCANTKKSGAVKADLIVEKKPVNAAN